MAKKKGPCCKNCAFGQDTGMVRYDVKTIACRRFPPKQDGNQQAPGPYPHPMLKETEWCGEHKPKTKTKK